MAVIYNGLIISTRKSAGGMNFYKRKGVQCLRNKPVRSAGYVQSAAQNQQNSVFRLVSDFKNNTPNVDVLVRGGWGESVRGKGRTPFNNFSSALLKAITRDAQGNLLRGEAKIASMVDFNDNPGKVFRDKCPLTKSAYESLGEGAVLSVAAGDGATGITLTIPKSVIDAWKAKLPVSYDQGTPVTQDMVFLTSSSFADSIKVPFFVAAPELSGTDVTVNFPDAVLTAGQSAEVAYGAYPGEVGDYGKAMDYAIGSIGLLTVEA